MTTIEPLVFNPFDPEMRSNPYPMYRRLLNEAPVYPTALGPTAFARYADCVAILRDPRSSSDELQRRNRTPEPPE